MTELRQAAKAFDAIAPLFDARFGDWLSVAAQRRAVLDALLAAFPPGGYLLELGGGTGEDAAWLAGRNFTTLLTDPSPAMVERARAKLAPLRSTAEIAAAEELEQFAEHHLQADGAMFDGAYSNFAPLNCVEELEPMARGLARLVRPGGSAMLVVFGVLSPGDILVEALRGRPRECFRRYRRGPVPARLGGQHFTVTYHRARDLARALRLLVPGRVRRSGVGVFVPPSAAEPWISGHPQFLGLLEALDRGAGRPLALLGDHILYRFETRAPPPP